jgi:catechol 2,3-dioxygenase-like lactoylglutathione lyase family enzyme
MRFWARRFDQLGFVVRDLDGAIAFWNKRMGVGPFVVNIREWEELKYYGEPSNVKAKFSTACAGETFIELIQPLTDAKSVYNDFLNSGQEGLQHLGYFTDDFENDYRACLESGWVVAQEAASAHDATTRFAYFDAPNEKGLQIELIGMSLEKRARFGAIRHQSELWLAENFARNA